MRLRTMETNWETLIHIDVFQSSRLTIMLSLQRPKPQNPMYGLFFIIFKINSQDVPSKPLGALQTRPEWFGCPIRPRFQPSLQFFETRPPGSISEFQVWKWGQLIIQIQPGSTKKSGREEKQKFSSRQPRLCVFSCQRELFRAFIQKFPIFEERGNFSNFENFWLIRG